MRNEKVKNMVITAMLIALVYLATNINIRLPISITGGGLVHLGMAMSIFAAIVFGKIKGAISAGIGMTLFDILSDYFLWAPFTLVISILIGYTVGAIASRKNNILFYIIAVFAASIIKVSGYYITEVILYHSFISPINSIPGNIMQMIVGGLVAVPLAVIIKKHPAFKEINTQI